MVLDLDRLGRLAKDLIILIDELAAKDIGFKAINSPMDTTTPTGRAFYKSKQHLLKWNATSFASEYKKDWLLLGLVDERRTTPSDDRREIKICPASNERPNS